MINYTPTSLVNKKNHFMLFERKSLKSYSIELNIIKK